MNTEERKIFNSLWYRFKGRVIGLLFNFDSQCMCGSGMRPHFEGGDVSCEYWKHHCYHCHEKQYCTLSKCKRVFIFKVRTP